MSMLLLYAGAAQPKLYYVIGPSSGWSDPTAAEIKLGQLSGGGAATASGNETSPTSTTTFDFTAAATGLTEGTAYKIAFVWSDGTNNSNVAVSSAFTPSAAVAASAGVATATAVGQTTAIATGSAAGTSTANANEYTPTVGALVLRQQTWTRPPSSRTQIKTRYRPISAVQPAGNLARDVDGSAFSNASAAVLLGGDLVIDNARAGSIYRTVPSTGFPLTYVLRGRLWTTGSNYAAAFTDGLALTKYVLLSVGSGASNSGSVSLTVQGSTPAVCTGNVTLLVGEEFTLVAVVAAADDHRLYFRTPTDLVKVTSTTAVGSFAVDTITHGGILSSSTPTFFGQLNQNLQLSAWLQAAVSEREAFALLDNPWQIVWPGVG